MTRFDLYIAGEPVAQGRPRFSTATGYVKAYDPAKSRDWKLIVGQMAREKMAGEGRMTGPLMLELAVTKTPPASWSVKRREHAIEYKCGIQSRPDLDNYLKIVLDALSGVVFDDDKQIVFVTASKTYSDTAGMSVSIREAT